MPDKIKVLIGDNENQWGDLCALQIDSTRYEVKVTQRNEFDILNTIKEFHPHIIILETFMSHITSIGFMAMLKDLPNYSPKFIIINSDGNIRAKKLALEYGASFYLVKPFGYDLLCDCIEQLASHFNAPQPKKEQSIDQIITRLLWDFKIPPHLKGYQYLRKSLLLAWEDYSIMDFVTKNLYPTVAEYFNTNTLSVERAIRNAITTSWQSADYDVLNKYFPGQKKKPSNSQFIATISEYLRIEYPELEANVSVG